MTIPLLHNIFVSHPEEDYSEIMKNDGSNKRKEPGSLKPFMKESFLNSLQHELDYEMSKKQVSIAFLSLESGLYLL